MTLDSATTRILLVALVAAVPIVFGDFTITLLNYVGIYTLVALGLVLLTGCGGLTSFGQAAFMGIGAYATGLLTTAWGLSPWIGLVVALALTALVALFLGYITLHLGGHYLPLTTIAWGLAIYLSIGNFEFLGRHGGISDIPPISLLGFSLLHAKEMYYLIWAVTGGCLLAAGNLLQSRQGRAIRALRGGSVMVRSIGIDVFWIRLCVFVIAAMLAGLAGWLYAHTQRFVSPSPFDLRGGIEFLLMAILGGAGHVSGAVIGAAAVALAKNWLQDVLPYISSNSANLEIVVFGALFIFLLHRSRGGIVPLLQKYVAGWSPPAPPGGKADFSLPHRQQWERGKIILKIEGLTKTFGGLVAVDDVGFDVSSGEVLALIGPNGAGKSTSFNLITGVLKPTKGKIAFDNHDLIGITPHEVVTLGIARTFQHVKLRPTMSVLDNVMLGCYRRTRAGFISGALRLDRREEATAIAEALANLQRVGLADKSGELAGNLPLGQQRLVEVARALASDPTLIMLDEPAAGLRGREKEALASLLRQLRADGLTILLVEHDMGFVMTLADRIVVLDFGEKLAEGTPSEIQANPAVREAYLGSVG